MISRNLAAVAAAALVFGTSAAVAQSAAPLGQAPAVERVGAETESAGELRGTTGWLIGAIALALIIWGALELFDDDDGTDSP